MKENLASDEPSDLIERFVEATRSLGPSEIRAAAGISPQALARYRGGDFKRIFASTRRKIESYLAQHAIPGGEAYNSVSPDIIQAVRTEAVEHIQRALEVLEGRRVHLTDDPAPVDDRVREAEERAFQEERKREQLEAELRRTKEELECLRGQAAAEPEPLPHISLGVVSGGLAEDEARAAGLRLVPDLDVEAAAGTEAYVEQELVVGHLALPEDWLARTCINPEQCRSIRVRGRSMEPTLQAGARILVDPQRTRRLQDHIYVVWTEDGLMVKRLVRDGDDWLLVSDNEDQETYPPVPWPEDAIVRGEVMWTGKTLRGST